MTIELEREPDPKDPGEWVWTATVIVGGNIVADATAEDPFSALSLALARAAG